ISLRGTATVVARPRPGPRPGAVPPTRISAGPPVAPAPRRNPPGLARETDDAPPSGSLLLPLLLAGGVVFLLIAVVAGLLLLLLGGSGSPSDSAPEAEAPAQPLVAAGPKVRPLTEQEKKVRAAVARG